ncbi:unnamed protein product [Phaedon cochleariae]|uniref:Uncharacterized protein n=1 Tax=Phaedon cochleariae TaxID=80249 RepID=A0A9N9SDI4_PHACE|nr:unnamed protein product [Phaedon cochleariae]
MCQRAIESVSIQAEEEKQDTFVELCGCGKPNKGHYASIRKVPLSMRHIERSISEVADLSPNLVEANSDMENSSQSRVPNSTQTSSLSSFRRSTSHHDPCRLKPAENRNGNREENREHFLNLPFGLSKIFVRADSNRSSNTANISNSSLRDTDVSEFIQSDPVDYMVEMNENIQ